MNLTRQRIAALLILTFVAMMLLGCATNTSIINPEFTATPGYATPAPGSIGSPDPAYADAQATIDAGQSQLLDLSRKDHRSQPEYDSGRKCRCAGHTGIYPTPASWHWTYQATVVSQNIAHAAATQKDISPTNENGQGCHLPAAPEQCRGRRPISLSGECQPDCPSPGDSGCPDLANCPGRGGFDG